MSYVEFARIIITIIIEVIPMIISIIEKSRNEKATLLGDSKLQLFIERDTSLVGVRSEEVRAKILKECIQPLIDEYI